MLRHTQQPYQPDEVAALLETLLERGWVALPAVYERASVPAFRQAVLEAKRGAPRDETDCHIFRKRATKYMIGNLV